MDMLRLPPSPSGCSSPTYTVTLSPSPSTGEGWGRGEGQGRRSTTPYMHLGRALVARLTRLHITVDVDQDCLALSVQFLGLPERCGDVPRSGDGDADRAQALGDL